MPAPYDAIIIGSGMGGLAAASLLAQWKGYRVLVLEQHFRLGGFTHAFSRPGGFHWEVGIHYVGRMAPGEPLRRAFDKLTAGQVQWTKMEDPFEWFSYPEFSFAVSSDAKRYENDLVAAFPQESDAIRRYFRDLRVLPKYLQRPYLPRALRPLFDLFHRRAKKLAGLTVKQGFDQFFRDERLKSVLASQWGDYGLPPAQAALLYHCMVAEHYLDGGYFPVGGGNAISRAIQPIVERCGGAMRVNHRVEEICVEKGRAVGVRVKHKDTMTEFRAREIYSDAGARNTFLKLLPKTVPIPFREDLARSPAGSSCTTLYLGLRAPPRTLGLHGQNLWIYDDWDHDAMFARGSELLEGKVYGCYVSFASERDPSARKHTAEILVFSRREGWDEWQDRQWMRRGAEYAARKDKIADALLALVESRVPGFTQLVEYRELSTPLTIEHFTEHPGGQVYGFPATPERLQKAYLHPRTPVKNLFLVGADAVGLGIAGAMIGGVMSVKEKHGYRALWQVLR